MTDYLKKYRETILDDRSSQFAEPILAELSSQLHNEWKDKGIITYVSTSQGSIEATITISLNLMSGSNDRQYFYRLIEIEQSMDATYPVMVRAFQNPPTDWHKIEKPTDLKNHLIEIMGDVRIKIVVEMIRQMGETIRSWQKEKDEMGEEVKRRAEKKSK